MFNRENATTVQHAELPEVNDELSVSLRIKLRSHHSNWSTIFQKGRSVYFLKIMSKLTTHGNNLGRDENGSLMRTPGLFLHANNSKLHPRFTGNWNDNAGIYALGDGLLLNKWYHITYTLSDPEKRMDIYIDGVWVAFYAIENVQLHKVNFNDKPLIIGWAIDGKISNFRYFNWRLSAEEVLKNYSCQWPFLEK
ncbi:hypothetical protein RclHR1_05520018 [Rhizophagus clarus]|nr:hypothetical protein RclHR1_05520018 [Rhizophagus clarus]